MPESLQSALSTLAAVVALVVARWLEKRYLSKEEEDNETSQ